MRHRFFTDYQKMLSFTIALCYKGRNFIIAGHNGGWDVRY